MLCQRPLRIDLQSYNLRHAALCLLLTLGDGLKGIRQRGEPASRPDMSHYRQRIRVVTFAPISAIRKCAIELLEFILRD